VIYILLLFAAMCWRLNRWMKGRGKCVCGPRPAPEVQPDDTTRQPERKEEAKPRMGEADLMEDILTEHQAYAGVVAFGETGAGKTTVMAHLQAAFMRQGAGMLILTAKVDDMDGILRIARETGREADLREFG